MTMIRISGHKHGSKQATLLVTLTAFTMVSLVPDNALAFESNLPHSPVPAFNATVQLAGRDPYLSQAIDRVPAYTYTAAGTVVSSPSPVTTISYWPKKRTWAPVKVAFAPNTLQVSRTDVLPIAEDKPVPTPAPEAPKAVPAAPAATPDSTLLVLEGEASFYSRAGCLGCNPGRIMANGQPLNDSALTMAIGANRKHLVGHTARVTSLATGKSTMVRITDTGGFYAAKYGNRVADLTIGTKQAIGMAGGVGHVRVEVF